MKITIEQASKQMGVKASTLREGIRQGAFPFATCFKEEGKERFQYFIFPEKFKEYYGEMKS